MVMEEIISFRIPKHVHVKVKHQADMKKQTLSDFMRKVLYEQLKRET